MPMSMKFTSSCARATASTRCGIRVVRYSLIRARMFSSAALASRTLLSTSIVARRNSLIATWNSASARSTASRCWLKIGTSQSTVGPARREPSVSRSRSAPTSSSPSHRVQFTTPRRSASTSAFVRAAARSSLDPLASASKVSRSSSSVTGSRNAAGAVQDAPTDSPSTFASSVLAANAAFAASSAFSRASDAAARSIASSRGARLPASKNRCASRADNSPAFAIWARNAATCCTPTYS